MQRREWLKSGLTASACAAVGLQASAHENSLPSPPWLRNATRLADQFVAWQTPYGAVDPQTCPYRSEEKVIPTLIQGIGPQSRALYLMFEATGDERYKAAADRYAVFLMNTVHDPPTPYDNKTTIDGERRYCVSTSWMYGKALSPCYEWFMRHHPDEYGLELKAYAIYRWLQRHRRDDSYFGVGYPTGEFEDAQFSCDLGEVGGGLVGFYNTTGHEPALKDAVGLAEYFLTPHQPGSAKGVWSEQLGTWLVGPWPGGGAEHFTKQKYNESGWGWSCLVVGEFLLELRRLTDNDRRRAQIDDRCRRAFQWCLDACQFDDGAHGMFGRDDKWVGQTAAAILLYAKLRGQNVLSDDDEREYGPKIRRSWQWLRQHTGPDEWPEHGYIKVTGATTTKPGCNIMWMMAWTVEALLAGGNVFESA
jgi:hypothetical protein